MRVKNLVGSIGRGLLAPGLSVLLAIAPASAAELPATEDALVETIRTAIEGRDYAALEGLVFWKGAGEIKKRIVRFELSRQLGRQIREITIRPYPKDGLDGAIATGKLAPNMEMTHSVHVVFDEEPLAATGKRPTAVFLVGKRDDVFRIGLVNRSFKDDDDD